MKFSVNFFAETVNYLVKNKRVVRQWIVDTIVAEGKCTGEICIVVCDDEYLSNLNLKYLNHSTLTDILTFPYDNDDGLLNGDIFISLQRIRENSLIFDQPAEHELHRVMIHGILHLIGYNDSTKKEKDIMRKKEDFYLECLKLR